MLNEDQIKHVAKLARIALTDEEVKKFSSQLSKVFDYMEILNELDTKNVMETSQVTGLNNIMGKDEIGKSLSKREELLKCSSLSIDSDQIRVLPAIKAFAKGPTASLSENFDPRVQARTLRSKFF